MSLVSGMNKRDRLALLGAIDGDNCNCAVEVDDDEVGDGHVSLSELVTWVSAVTDLDD